MVDQSISRRRLGTLGAAFLCSGAAGLIYQVAWQRLLFANFGVDLISVCIIVSTFMLGLGLGALAGGWLGDRFPAATLKFFVLCEVAIGLFGLVSPFLIRALGSWLSDASFAVSGLANFLLMLIPTFFMGAMLGCSLTAFWLFNRIELDQAIQLAAAINFTVAAAVGVSFKGATK